MINIVATCPFCQTDSVVTVEEKDYENWLDGELAQDAFPYLWDDEKELLISGTCSNCWDKLFF